MEVVTSMSRVCGACGALHTPRVCVERQEGEFAGLPTAWNGSALTVAEPRESRDRHRRSTLSLLGVPRNRRAEAQFRDPWISCWRPSAWKVL
jgi:hypothetical protein